MSRSEPAYWRGRLFKNTFTYRGRSVEVRGWCVRIQISGKRKTFSLRSSEKSQASGEACRIYHTILENGWDGMARGRAGSGRIPLTHGLPVPPASAESDVDYWRHRLIHRKYPEDPRRGDSADFAVRVEHAGIGHYFPLGTANEAEAAAKAMGIYRKVVEEGWAFANKSFTRELSLALRWQDNPLAWTYTTIHTRLRGSRPEASPGARTAAERNVVIIEPDAGIRSALAEYTECQEGFRCGATFASAADALRGIPNRRVDVALCNYELPESPGVAFPDDFERLKPGLPVVCYSVFDDADQLFKSAPGGAVGYMLKRTLPFRLLEPIAESQAPISREQIAARVRDYFQRLSALLPSGPGAVEVAKLTPREHEILTLLSKGKLAKEIAESLRISVWTVQDHMKSIFEKLNVHTRTEAVVKYLQK